MDNPSSEPQISVIIRCFNEEEHIGRLLTGIMVQTRQDVEIVVVDSGSTDATLSVAGRFPVRVVHIDPSEFSFGRSLNRGCEAARGNVIVAASAHVYPTRHDWLERLVEPFSDPTVGLVYGKQRGNHITHLSEHRILETWFPNESTPDQAHPFCNNANAAVRRDLWQTLRYDEELTGLEDLEFAKRAMGFGHKLAYAADAEVIHIHNETPRRVFNRYRREAIAHKQIFPDQTFTFLDFVHLTTQNIASDVTYALRQRATAVQAPTAVWFRAAQFFGTWRGFNRTEPVTNQLKRRFYYPSEQTVATENSTENPTQPTIDYSHLEQTQTTWKRSKK